MAMALGMPGKADLRCWCEGALLAILLLVAHACDTGSARAAEPPADASRPVMLAQLADEPEATVGSAEDRAMADREPDAALAPAERADFLHRRGLARKAIGRLREANADFDDALSIGLATAMPFARVGYAYYRELTNGLLSVGDWREAIRRAEERIAYATRTAPQDKAVPFSARVVLLKSQLALGDIEAAERTLAEMERLYADLPQDARLLGHHRNLSQVRAAVAWNRGRFAESEKGWRDALADSQSILATTDTDYGPREIYENDQVFFRDGIARLMVAQGRYADAEAMAREAHAIRLKLSGRNDPRTAGSLAALAMVLSDGRRNGEAERLAKDALAIYANSGSRPTDGPVLAVRTGLAMVQARQGHAADALVTYEAIRADLGSDRPSYERLLGHNSNYAFVLLDSGHNDEAIQVLRSSLDWHVATWGREHIETAVTQGLLGAALARIGQQREALEAFRAAVPRIIAVPVEDISANQVQNTRLIINGYGRLLDELRATRHADADAPEDAAGMFLLAQHVHVGSVQKALTEASARIRIDDPDLAALIRQDQDTGHQIAAMEASLLSLTSRSKTIDLSAVAGFRKRIAALTDAREKLQRAIGERDPGFEALSHPRPLSIEQVRAALRPDEALVMFADAGDRMYGWALSKGSPLAFASIALGHAEARAIVTAMRSALSPVVDTVDEIPPFDLANAYRLYAQLLEPVRQGWSAARTLTVVADGPLAQLPLSLLVTAPTPQPAADSATLLFAAYRDVPFLVRQVAIAYEPSVGALALRPTAPLARQAERKPFIGFGDPWFSKEQAEEAATTKSATTVASRGLPVRLRAAPPASAADTSQLAELPRLPETADEVREIARTLHANPGADVFVGRRASEQNVRTMKLDDRRVVMFATHGLVPGDLRGLRQPALALSAPAVTGERGDGLLTLDKILALKLDADWVVLSACNTASGDGAGAEALSGLGRAFFYAGGRALLATSWPVETTSAQALTVRLFQIEAGGGTSRAQALRQTMIELIDGGVRNDPRTGKPAFSYAHPIFWAAYALYGDGGTS